MKDFTRPANVCHSKRSAEQSNELLSKQVHQWRSCVYWSWITQFALFSCLLERAEVKKERKKKARRRKRDHFKQRWEVHFLSEQLSFYLRMLFEYHWSILEKESEREKERKRNINEETIENWSHSAIVLPLSARFVRDQFRCLVIGSCQTVGEKIHRFMMSKQSNYICSP